MEGHVVGVAVFGGRGFAFVRIADKGSEFVVNETAVTEEPSRVARLLLIWVESYLNSS